MGRSHPKLNFFQIWKRQFCSIKTQDIQTKIAKENFPRWRIFSKCRLYFFLYENMSCDRCFSSIELIFGLSQYFLTFNYSKINFRFLDHPNMGLPYNFLEK
jgi:hypothetical protein